MKKRKSFFNRKLSQSTKHLKSLDITKLPKDNLIILKSDKSISNQLISDSKTIKPKIEQDSQNISKLHKSNINEPGSKNR